MNDFIFREAELPDLEAIAKLVYELNLYHDDDFEPCAKTLKRDWGFFEPYVVCSGASVVGFLVGYNGYKFHAATRRFEIQNLYVKETYRHRGVGRMLFENVIKLKYENGIEHFSLAVYIDNKVARSFYEAVGFNACPMQDMRYVLKANALQSFIERVDSNHAALAKATDG
jgi:ribosomal protein S18 acetylase RimI-like enzyme